MIELGSKVRDLITGFIGVATGRGTWLTGCDRYHITSTTLHKGKTVEEWFDENRLVVLAAKPIRVEEAATNPGGPQPDPSKPTAGR